MVKRFKRFESTQDYQEWSGLLERKSKALRFQPSSRKNEKLTQKQMQTLKNAFSKDNNIMFFITVDGYNIAYTKYYLYATKGSLDELKDVFGNDEREPDDHVIDSVREWMDIRESESVGTLKELMSNTKDGKCVVETPNGYGIFSQKTLNEVGKFFTGRQSSLNVYVKWNVDLSGVLVIATPSKDEVAISITGDVHLATERDFNLLSKDLEDRIAEEFENRLDDFSVHQEDKSVSFRIDGVHFSQRSLDTSHEYVDSYKTHEITVRCSPKGSATHPHIEVWAYAPDTSIPPKTVARFLIKNCFHWKTSSGYPDNGMIDYDLNKIERVVQGNNTMDFSSLETKRISLSMVSMEFSDSFDDAMPVIAEEITNVCNDYAKWVDGIRSELVKQYQNDPDVKRYKESGEVPSVKYPRTLKDFVASTYATGESRTKRSIIKSYETVRKSHNDYFTEICKLVDEALEKEGFKADITVYSTGTADIRLIGNEEYDFNEGYVEMFYVRHGVDGDYIRVCNDINRGDDFDVSCNEHLVADVVDGILEFAFE